MCELNSIAFDEVDFEFGQDNFDYFVILRKDKGQKNEVVENDDEDDMGIVDSYGDGEWW